MFIFEKKVDMVATYFLCFERSYDMTKEPQETKETTLPEMKRRKRKVPATEHSMLNISYQSLLELYLKECRRKGLVEETITGYKYASAYFLDFTGYELMCSDITQDLINEYYLYLQQYHKASTTNSYVFKISPIVKYGIDKGYIREDIEFTHCKEQKEIKNIFTPEELSILLKRPIENDFCEIRAWTIINLFLATGIRAKELRFLKIKDV